MSVLDDIKKLLDNKMAKLQSDLVVYTELGDFGQLEIIDRQIVETQAALDKLK